MRALHHARTVLSTPAAKVAAALPARILAVDVGGTKIKVLATGENKPRKIRSGKRMTPQRMVERVKELTFDWQYDAVALGYPGQVGAHGPRSEPGNLGPGWVGFNFAAAFGRPVRIINDAAMQALGSYEDGRMLFLGLGTGLGSTLIADNVIVPLELGQLAFRDGETLGAALGRKGLARLGKDVWRSAVKQAITFLIRAFVVDYVVIGGGNSKKVKDLPPGARLGHNLTAFRGGYRLWSLADVTTLSADGTPPAKRTPTEWRVI
jgi:predicted NBD/HSP70 family sugar kinase